MSTSNAITALKALIRKDLVLYFSNRRALIMSIAAPIVIAAFFGSLFGATGGGPSKIAVAIADHDASPLSMAIVKALGSDPAFDVHELGEAAAVDEARRGKVRAAIVLPAGLGMQLSQALLAGGKKPALPVHYDPSQSTALPLVKGLLAQHVMEALGKTLGGGAPGSSFALPFTTQPIASTSSTDRPYNSYAHSFAGMGVQFILFMGIEVGVGVLLARRLGLWKRLRAAPLSRSLLLGSHILSGAITALVLLAIIYAAAMLFFHVRIDGSVAGFVGVAIAFALLTSSFGLLIAALGKTPEATRGLAIFATLVMVMLGGAWVPSFVFPKWLQTASLVVPTRWAVDGLDAMTWRGLGFDAAIAPIAMLLAFSALFAAIAIWRFDWEEPHG
ncbi:MAG: ABC transporter permease [Pseudomonadota bacterium]|nr:ABC transporter permease [Pseudomonadota bacterium]